MPNPNPTLKKLLEDRIEFKFYAAEKHLHLLSDMQAKGKTPDNSEARIDWELEIEELLFHLIGAMDCLLFRINERLKLGLEIQKVTAINVCSKLRLKKNDLIKELWDLVNPHSPVHSWLKILTDLRNTGTNRSIINVSFAGGNMHITFVKDPKSELEVIPYLDDRIQRMRELIDNIISKDPSLRRKFAPKKRRT
jgi:hypothetical protein